MHRSLPILHNPPLLKGSVWGKVSTSSSWSRIRKLLLRMEQSSLHYTLKKGRRAAWNAARRPFFRNPLSLRERGKGVRV